MTDRIHKFSDFGVFLYRNPVDRNMRWESVVPAGHCFIIMTDGHLTSNDEHLGLMEWQAGDIFLRNSPVGCESNNRAVSSGILGSAILHFYPGALARYLPHANAALSGGPKRLRDTPDKAVLRLAAQMQHHPESDPLRELTLNRLGFEIVETLVRELPGGKCDAQTLANGCWSDPREKIREIGRQLLQDLSGTYTTESLARAYGMSPRRLNAGFKSVFGVSVHNYLKSHRLHHAMSLLRSSDMPVSTVAYEVGYNPAHFSTEFRREFGCAPSQVSEVG